MQGRDQDRKQKSNYGGEGGGGEGSNVHVCHRCRWPFSNAHPSQKKRAAHKKHCGKIEGYPLVISAAQCDGERVEEGSVGNFSNGSSVTVNFEEVTLEEEKNLENAGAMLEVRGMIEADSFEDADRTPNPGASEAEYLERNDTENDNTHMLEYGDIAAKQLDSIVEFQDNMSFDCCTEVSSSFQSNNDSFDCSMKIRYPLQPKIDLLLAQTSIHEKDPAVDSEDKELACVLTSTILPEYSSSNLEGIDLKLDVPRDGKAEPVGECQLGIISVDLLVTSCSPVIIACPGDITKSNQIGTTSEKLSHYSLSPRTNASGMDIEASEHAKPVDVASLFASCSAEAFIQPVNQSENDLEGTQIDSILLPRLPALDIHLDEVEDLRRVSAHSNNSDAHNDGESLVFFSDIHELYKAEIPVAKVNDVLEDITCDNSTSEVHFEDHRATSNDVITSSVQLQVVEVEDSSGKVASCLDLSPDISCQDDIQNRSSTFDHVDAYVVEEKMGCHTNNARDDSENDSHASQECEQKEMQNNKKLCIESGFDKHTDEDNLFYRGCTDLGNDSLNDTENDSLASQECEEKEIQNNQKLCIESGFDTHTDEGNAFCHRSIYLGNDAINNTESDSLAFQKCEEEIENNQKLYLESGFDTHTSEDNMFYHGGTNLGNDDIRENEFREEPTENIVCPNIDVTKNVLESISDAGLTLHDIDMDNTQKRSMLNDYSASVGFTSKLEAGIKRDESKSFPEDLNDHLNSNHGNQFGINCYNPKHPIDNGCWDQSKTIQPSQDSNCCKEANICAVSEEVASSKENQPLIDNFLNNDKENSDDLVFVDGSDGTIDQRECNEGYCIPKFDKLGAISNSSQGSACNLPTDVPCDPDVIETGQQPTSEIRPIDTDEQSTSMSRNTNLSPQNKANESHGRKKKDEIKSRVVDWQHLKDGIVEENKKPHVPLKNLLGEANHEGKNSLKNSLEQMVFSTSREADTLQHGYSKENIQTSMNESESSPVRADAKVMQKEWNSPARLPVKKDAKGKTKGKPQWTPFMCCSSNAI